MELPELQVGGMGASREASTQPGLGGSGSIGILFDRTSPAGPFTIQGVTPGSTAALCGRIAAGDLLHGVGRTPVYELDRQQAMALLLGRDGSDVTLWTSKAPTDGEPRPPVTGVKVKRDSYANADAEAGADDAARVQRIEAAAAAEVEAAAQAEAKAAQEAAAKAAEEKRIADEA